MFFVFGPMGQMYRGSGDRLTQVAAVRRVQRPQALRTRAPAPQAETPAHTQIPARDARSGVPAPSMQALQAVSAYAQTELGPAEPRQPLTRVSDVMTHMPLTMAPDILVNDAWQRMADLDVAQMPVVSDAGRVIGLLLRADMAPLDLLPAPGAIREAIALARRPVSQVMISPVPTVSADTALRRVARVLLDTDLPGLPVTDADGRLQGFVSRNDILHAVAAEPPLDLWSGPAPAQA